MSIKKAGLRENRRIECISHLNLVDFQYILSSAGFCSGLTVPEWAPTGVFAPVVS
jgi:hypothetical protein